MNIPIQVLFLLISMGVVCPQPEDPSERDCYPFADLEWSSEAGAMYGGLSEAHDLINGKKQFDAESFKNIFLGWIAWQNAGVKLAEGIPEVGGIIGALGNFRNIFTPQDVSTELKCMRVLLKKISLIISKLDRIQEDITRILKVLEGQVSQVSYGFYRMHMNKHATNFKKFLKGNPQKVIDACEDTINFSPFATLDGIGKLVLGEGLGGAFIETVITQAGCDDSFYVKTSSIVMNDIAQLVSMMGICHKLINNEVDKKHENEIAAGHVARLSHALLAGRLSMQQQCIKKDIENGSIATPFKGFQCSAAQYAALPFMKSVMKKYPLIQPSKLECVNFPTVDSTTRSFCVSPTTNVHCQRSSEVDVQNKAFKLEGSDDSFRIQIGYFTDVNQAANVYLQQLTASCTEPDHRCWACENFDEVVKCERSNQK